MMAESRYPSSRDTGSGDTGSTNGGGWSQYPAERGLRRQLSRQPRRQQCRERAARLLSCYLGQVSAALRAEGLTVSETRIGPGPDLEAQLRLHPTQPHSEPGGEPGRDRGNVGSNGDLPASTPYPDTPTDAPTDWVDRPLSGPTSPFELSWAEDTGWRVEHDLLGGPTGAAPWRYLHLELAPAPSVVARFAVAVLTGFDDVGMPYPAQFRFRSQPLQPVIDALVRHTTPPAASDINTEAATEAAVGEGLGEPVTESRQKEGTGTWD